MSAQKFPPFVRRAIWESHSKACAYCGELIRYRDCEIDHIVPEKFFFDGSSYEQLKVQAGLPNDFNLRGYENLLPSCSLCNNKKSDTTMRIPSLLLLLDMAQKKKTSVERKIEQLKSEDQSDKMAFRVLAGLTSGRVKVLEIEQILKDLKTSEGKFSVSKGLDVFNGMPIRELTAGDIQALLDRQVIFAEGMEPMLKLHDDDHREILVDTLGDYRKAEIDGFYPLTNSAMRIASSYFLLPLEILDALEIATYADVSYIDEPRCGVNDIHLLPHELLCDLNEGEFLGQDCSEHTDLEQEVYSIGHLIDLGLVEVKGVSSDLIELHHEDFCTRIFEIMRADFNGDGIQDLLVYKHCNLLQGTLHFGRTEILSRLNNDSIFNIARNAEKSSSNPPSAD